MSKRLTSLVYLKPCQLLHRFFYAKFDRTTRATACTRPALQAHQRAVRSPMTMPFKQCWLSRGYFLPTGMKTPDGCNLPRSTSMSVYLSSTGVGVLESV